MAVTTAQKNAAKTQLEQMKTKLVNISTTFNTVPPPTTPEQQAIYLTVYQECLEAFKHCDYAINAINQDV